MVIWWLHSAYMWDNSNFDQNYFIKDPIKILFYIFESENWKLNANYII